MGVNNFELLRIAESHLGQGGAVFRRFCGLPANAAWCNAYVCYIFNEGGDVSLFYGGKKVTYCPTSLNWCRANLAQIPIYLALPMDVIYFDWEPNNVPNHIGFVRERVSDLEVKTIEGNTSGGIVANKTRPNKYVCGCFRPYFPVAKSEYSTDVTLEIDGLFGYNSISMLQKALGVTQDAILGRGTVKALQKRAGVTQDALFGPGTARAVQRMCGLTGKDLDGCFGPKSVKALQEWINAQNGKGTNSSPSVTRTKGDAIADTAKKYIGKVKYVKGGTDLKKGVDCTGFVQAIYGLNGIHLDNKLSSWGKSIGTNVNKAKPGDIFTYKDKTGIHHGIYVGGGKVVHAANKKDGVKMSKWNSMSRPLVGIRRRWK